MTSVRPWPFRASVPCDLLWPRYFFLFLYIHNTILPGSGFPLLRAHPLRWKERLFHSATACGLNRFLFSSTEVDHKGSVPTVTLSKDDYRTVHASKILGLSNGDVIRAGVVSCAEHDGLTTDTAPIQWIPEGKVDNGDPPGSLFIELHGLQAPTDAMSPFAVSLMLALPRPLQLGRMLPMIAQMGVDHLILTDARKVPKDYFGSHLFRKPDQLTERLVEGLCQAGDVRLPQVQVVKNLSNFLNQDLDRLFPADRYARVIAHPQRPQHLFMDATSSTPVLRMRQVEFPPDHPRKMVLAVGPEGGWQEPNELDRFQSHGFQQVTLGSRVLRSDCAVVSLLCLAHDVCADY